MTHRTYPTSYQPPTTHHHQPPTTKPPPTHHPTRRYAPILEKRGKSGENPALCRNGGGDLIAQARMPASEHYETSPTSIGGQKRASGLLPPNLNLVEDLNFGGIDEKTSVYPD